MSAANRSNPHLAMIGLKRAAGRRSLLVTDSVAARRASARFEQFISKLAHRKFGEMPSPLCVIALCAIAFDVPAREDQLLSYLQALPQLRTWGDREYVTWENDGQTHRRVPSVFTLLAIRSVDLSSVDWRGVLAQVERTLARCYPFADSVPIGRRIQAVLRDGLAFLEYGLPRPLFAHLAGEIPWTPLPSSVWERRDGALPAGQGQDADAASLSVASAAVVETIYEGEAPLTGGWFVQQLHSVCNELVRPGVKRSNRRIRTVLVSRLHDLSKQLDEAGPVEALLLGWALDIVTFGSARRADPTVKTLSNYLKAAVKPLHAAMSQRRQHPLSLRLEQWKELFEGLLDAHADALLRPALASFQRYMVRAHDAEALPWLFRGSADVRTPRPNILWEHEFAAIPWLLTNMLHDERSLQQTTVWLEVLRTGGLRFGELIQLELRSLAVLEGGSVRIAVSAARGRPGLKTDAARRVIEICEPSAATAIRCWFDRRTEEASSRDELLFGDPHRPASVYRLAACYGALAQAIKEASGDASITVHAIRHTFATIRVEAALLASMSEFSEIRRLEELRVQMGHAELSTTLMTYCHLYEDVLRVCMDTLLERSEMPAQAAAKWTLHGRETEKDYAQTLESCAAKFRSRDRRRPDWSAWSELHCRTRPAAADRQTAESAFAAPSLAQKPLTLQCVHDIAADWSAGMELRRIQLRSGHTTEIVSAVVRELESACVQVRIARRARKPVSNGWERWFKEESNLRRLDSARWRAAITVLENTLTQSSSTPVGAWLQACAGVGIDAHHPALRDVLGFLLEVGFGAEMFVIRASAPSKIGPISDAFVDVFASCAQTELVTARRGKPSDYVQILTRPVHGNVVARPASSDMKTLRGLLLLATAYQNVTLIMKEPK